jgi:transposase
VQGRHEEQTSDALGAAAVQIGPNVLALATEMKHRLGISYGKLRSFFWTTFQILISRGTFARADQRIGAKLAPTYEVVKIGLRSCAAVYADETGWKIGGHKAWLWVFTEEALTVYVIDTSRGHEVAEEVLGKHFQGTLISDCFLAYDPLECTKQKCLSHILKRCSEIEAMKSRGAVGFSRRVAALLRAAMRLKERRAKMSEHGYKVACGRIEAAMDRLLESHLTDPENAKLATQLKKHRESLFRFLYEEAVEATNNRAERALRPAVIARKLSAGNRTPRGARTHAVIASVVQTCRQQGKDFLAGVKDVLRSSTPLVLSLGGAAPPDT